MIHDPGAALEAAIAHHQAGVLDEAEARYREVIAADPGHADALHLLGVVRHQRGDHEAAIELIGRAIAVDDGAAAFHSNLGEALRAGGRPEEARAAYDRAIAADPGFADAHVNKGAMLLAGGDARGAVECLRAAAAIRPDLPDTRVRLAGALRACGAIDEALAAARDAVHDAPDRPGALLELAAVETRAGDLDAALANAERAVALDAGSADAWRGLGAVHLEAGAYPQARDAYHRVYELAHCGPWMTASDLDAALALAPESDAAVGTTVFELTDAAEHVEHLVARGLVHESFAALATRWRTVLETFPRDAAPRAGRMLDREASRSLTGLFRKALRYEDRSAPAGGAVGADLDFARAESRYIESPTAVISLDGFLSAGALDRLRRFCLDSTIFCRRFGAEFVPAYLDEGFDCTLLFEVVAELRRRFPRILGRQALRNMWAYRYPAESAGVRAHTDQGAVTFNFWITPDEANLDPRSGGLLVYAKEQPMEWDWDRVNAAKDRPEIEHEIAAFLDGAPTVEIPYRANRALLFHSNLFHRSLPFRFREGYENRRMNVTLLFGERGTDARRPHRRLLSRLRAALGRA